MLAGRFMVVIVLVILLVNSLNDTLTAQSSDIKSTVAKIQQELEEIRGKKFKHAVKVQNQSDQDFNKYLDKTFNKQFPAELIKNYGKVIKKLGLYNGPEIKDLKHLIKTVMQSQAAAYYDPDKGTFFVLMQNLPEQMLGSLYSHELYHGLQDQYFDLNQYLLDKASGELNDDELLARQAVIEGEATYLMTLWTTQNMIGIIPDASMLRLAINMQAELGLNQLVELLKNSALPQSDEIQISMKTLDEIPPFIIETMIGAYVKGMRFIFEVQQHGWGKIDKLYLNPPVSTEQILYPEKWLANERPFKYRWPSFKNTPLLNDWKLLEQNSIGEIQWRIIFSEFNLADSGITAAEGWNGDSFIVLEHKSTKRLLLLIITSWDSEKDANEFGSAYLELLKQKYPNDSANSMIRQFENDVLIIEGKDIDLESLLGFLKKVEKTMK